jgi:hypothetical protein
MRKTTVTHNFNPQLKFFSKSLLELNTGIKTEIYLDTIKTFLDFFKIDDHTSYLKLAEIDNDNHILKYLTDKYYENSEDLLVAHHEILPDKEPFANYLIENLKNMEKSHCWEACSIAVSNIDISTKNIVQFLLKNVHSRSSQIRRSAISSLKILNYHERSYLLILIDLLTFEPDFEIKKLIASNIANLIDLLSTKDMYYLQKLFIFICDESDPEIKGYIISCLAQLSATSKNILNVFIGFLKQIKSNSKMQQEINDNQYSLKLNLSYNKKKYDKSFIVETLIFSNNPDKRIWAMLAIKDSEFCDDSLIALIAETLRGESKKVKMNAIKILGNFTYTNEKVVFNLIQTLGSQDFDLKVSSFYSLKKFVEKPKTSELVIRNLFRTLGSSNISKRSLAITLLIINNKSNSFINSHFETIVAKNNAEIIFFIANSLIESNFFTCNTFELLLSSVNTSDQKTLFMAISMLTKLNFKGKEYIQTLKDALDSNAIDVYISVFSVLISFDLVDKEIATKLIELLLINKQNIKTANQNLSSEPPNINLNDNKDGTNIENLKFKGHHSTDIVEINLLFEKFKQKLINLIPAQKDHNNSETDLYSDLYDLLISKSSYIHYNNTKSNHSEIKGICIAICKRLFLSQLNLDHLEKVLSNPELVFQKKIIDFFGKSAKSKKNLAIDVRDSNKIREVIVQFLIEYCIYNNSNEVYKVPASISIIIDSIIDSNKRNSIFFSLFYFNITLINEETAQCLLKFLTNPDISEIKKLLIFKLLKNLRITES